MERSGSPVKYPQIPVRNTRGSSLRQLSRCRPDPLGGRRVSYRIADRIATSRAPWRRWPRTGQRRSEEDTARCNRSTPCEPPRSARRAGIWPGARPAGAAKARARALAPGQRRRRRRLEYARHGRSIGGESPLEEEVVLTPSRRQLRRREAGWEGSPRRNPAPRNTNRVKGGAIWVSLLKKVKPVTINRVAT